MNPVGELLSASDIELDLDAPTKEAVLLHMATLLARRGGLVEAEVLGSLEGREQLGSTALGHGLAIPHARMSQCGAASAAFVRTRTGVAFDAPDGRPVSVFLGLIVPKEANERHLKLLATAAAMFSDRPFREKLKTDTDAAAVRALIAGWPDFVAAPQPAAPAQ